MAGGRAIAAILAGGAGTRLGGAKPSADLGGAALISYPVRAAAAADLEPVIVAKAGTPLPQLDCGVLREPQLPLHPLCGVVTALRHAQDRAVQAVVLLACDMPFLTGALLSWLAGLEGAAMARVGGRDQPLLSRVPTAALQSLDAALAREAPLARAIGSLSPRIVHERELVRFGDPARLLFGVNDREDLARARDWLEPPRRSAANAAASARRDSGARRRP